LVVERSRGDIVEPDYWATPKSERIALQLAEQMGRLHAQPLGNLAAVLPHSRPRSDRQGWLEELDRIAADWGTLAHWPSVTASAALEWLRANTDCVEDRQSLVHNDMVFHNILSQGDQLTAILDWEQVGVGHPAEDLGYCYPPVSGVLDWDRFLRAYHAAGGPAISRRQVDYFAQPVRDVDHSRSTRREVANHRLEQIDLVAVQRLYLPKAQDPPTGVMRIPAIAS